MAYGTRSIDERKRIALQVWVDNPLLSFEEVAAKAGIADKTFYRYRQDPAFMDEYKKMCQERFKTLEGKAVYLLNEQLDAKNWNAIKYALDSLGYKPTDKVEQVTETTIKVSVEDDEQ